jgi:ABC-type branched-subunit amino acid transport system substrate-binding protein
MSQSSDRRYSRRQFVTRSFAGAGAVAFGGGVLAACGASKSSGGGGGGGGGGGRDIKIGALIPFTGLETHNGKAMQYGTEIAVDEINKAGGIAGGKIKLMLADSAASVDQGVQKAQKFITEDRVDLINGTLLSNVRAAVFDVCKKAGVPFMNPTFYEGLLCSKYYFSTGAPPNLTIEPLAKYARKNLGKSVYFIGSDYIWGTGSVKAAKQAVADVGGTVAGSPRFVPLGTTDFSAEIRRIQAAKPDIVWPFVAGQDGITFLKQLTDAGVRSNVQIVGDYFDELFIPALSPETYEGIVNCSTYFMNVDNAANKQFLQTLNSKYGNDAKISSFGMNMYNNLKLLEVAAKDLDGWDKDQVAQKLQDAEFEGPAGRVKFVPDSHHAEEDAYIGVVQKDGSFKIVETEPAVQPKPGCSI